jgi:heme oxygenase (mycobilin-producing)
VARRNLRVNESCRRDGGAKAFHADGGIIMAVKILIQRKVKPAREKELNTAVRELRSKAIHARGYISGETLCSIDDPSVHLVMSTWKSREDWNRWADSAERKAFQQTIDVLLKNQRKLLPIGTNPFLLKSMNYSPALSPAPRISSESVPLTSSL